MRVQEPSNLWQVLLRQGIEAARSGDREGAQILFEQVSEHDPTASRVLAIVGSMSGELVRALIQQAWTALEAGNSRDAETLLLAATELDPGNSEASAMLQELKKDAKL